MEGTVFEIVEYQSANRPCFEKLNRAWIEKYFWMEPIDFEVLQRPEEHILHSGGSILVAMEGGKCVGTVALKKATDGIYEMTKMAVDQKFQGKKIGKALAESAIAWAKKAGGQKVILFSSTKLPAAIALYRKLGFQDIPVDGPYKRSDIKMELYL